MTVTDQEIWIRHPSQTIIPLEPWHLRVMSSEGVVAACGLILGEGELEEHEGIPESSPHGGGGLHQVTTCMTCYQVHLARLGVDLSDAPLGEDYVPIQIDPRQAATMSGTMSEIVTMALHPRSAFERIVEAGLEPFQITPERAGEECPACFSPLQAEQYATMVPLGPGADQEQRTKASDGRPYTAVAVRIHWGCATGLPDALAQGFIETKRQRQVVEPESGPEETEDA